MIKKIDSDLIKAYKFMLMEQLKKYNDWSMHNTGEYTHYNNKNYLSFFIHKNNDVDIKINSDAIYTFKNINNIDLYFKIIRFRKMKKHEKINLEIKDKEDKLKRALPDDYKRAVKISKIRSKI